MTSNSSEEPFETSERGFKQYEPIPTTYGHAVSVYESSAAMAPHIWVSIQGDCHLDEQPRPVVGIPVGTAKGSASAHMTLDQATRLRDEIDAAIANHYQAEDR